MLIGFLLLSAGGLLAQSPANEPMNKLAKQDTQDDEIRRERLKAARSFCHSNDFAATNAP